VSDSGPRCARASGAALLGLLAASWGGGGCSAECSGPGCATSYQTAHLSWITALQPGEVRDVSGDATGEWIGTLRQGTDWRVTTALGRALTGQPDADQVVATSARATQGDLNPLSTWSGEAGTGFGRDLVALEAASGTDLWVSAPDSGFGAGSVSLFRGTDLSARTHDLTQAWTTLVGATPNDRLGTSLVACGDLAQSDGAAELLIGSPWFAQPERDVPWRGQVPSLAGAVFLVRSYAIDNRAGTFFPWEVGSSWFAPETGAGAGQAMACDLDLDEDGAIDVLIGAPYASAGAGRLYVLAGASLPDDGSLDGVPYLEGFADDDWFGASVVTFVHNGAPFVAVGAPGAEAGAGRVYLFRGTDLTEPAEPVDPLTGALTAEPRTAFSSPAGGVELPGTHFGRTLEIGDLDGDDRDDLIVGTPDAQGPNANDFDTGAVEVWFGRRNWEAEEPTPDVRILGTDPFQRIGRSVAPADLDGDGIDELLLPTRSRTPTR
jgi:hypothetical protein